MHSLRAMLNQPIHVSQRTTTLGKFALLFTWLIAMVATVSPTQFGAWLGHRFLLVSISLIAFILLYVFPGLVLIRWLWRDATLDGLERLMLAIGIGTLLPPLWINLGSVLNFSMNRWTTWAYTLLMFLIWIASYRRNPLNHIRSSFPISWYSLITLTSFALVIFTRFYSIRDLEIPLWGDSYHHTMITQLLSDNGGLFTTWLPYAELYSFTYHYGFHANAVFFHWLTGIAAPQSVLITGQLMNVSAVAMAYVFTTRLCHNRLAGLIALVLTGFVNTMPAYYVNWGRYTQLTGQVMLVVVLLAWIHTLERSHVDWRSMIMGVIATSALVLTHYIVTIFAIAFLFVYVLVLTARKANIRDIWRILIISTLIVLTSLIITAPWLINLFNGRLTNRLGTMANNQAQIASGATFISIIPFYIKSYIVGLAFVGLWISIAQRCWKILLAGIWSTMLFFLVVPYIIKIPITGVVTTFAIIIALYLTIIPIASYALAAGFQYLQGVARQLAISISIVTLVGLTLSGIQWQSRVVDPQFQLFTPADAQAMEWINQNTEPQAKFLVNSLLAYNDFVIAGDDGGWWIPLLTGRKTMLPPITYASERGPTVHYLSETTGFLKQLLADPLPSEHAVQLLQDAGIQYIYVGPHIGIGNERYRINVQALRYRPEQFPIVYERDGVIIFAIKGSS